MEVLGQFVKDARLNKLREALDRRTKSVRMVLENLDCQHNVSALLRTCDGFGVHHVDLIESAFSKGSFSLNRDVSKSCEKYLAISRFTSTQAWLEQQQQQDTIIVATELGAPDISTVDWAKFKHRPIRWVFLVLLLALMTFRFQYCDGE